MKALIHIGMPKTGSSSIQEFLKINREGLAARGVLYAPNNPDHGSQFELAVAGRTLSDNIIPEDTPRKILGLPGMEEQRRYLAAYEAFLDAQIAEAPDAWLFVASSEHIQPWLNRVNQIRALDRFLRSRFSSVRYVVYLREQADLLVSAWSERIRRGEVLDLDTHVEQRLAAVNYDAMVALWEKAIGTDRLDVRLLRSDWMEGGDLITDFCAAMGVERAGLAEPRRMNNALSAETARLRLRLNRVIPVRRKDGSLNPWYFRALRLLGRRLPRPGTRIALTDAQRARVQASVRDSNEALRARRFPDLATLF